jgi:hypothetical protein
MTSLPEGAIADLFYASNVSDIRKLRVLSDEYTRVYMEVVEWVNLARYINFDSNADAADLKKRSKIDQLQIFIDYFDYLPPQGSKAWKDSREAAEHLPPMVGGSQIYDITRGNASKKKEFYKGKLGLSSFTGNKWTRWGNLFEPMIQLYCDIVLETTTYETGSIPGLRDKNGNVIQSYSPDGLNVLKAKTFAEFAARGDIRPELSLSARAKEWLDILTPYMDAEGDIINLMEYKCPPSRIPDGKVPPQYYSQPRAGACTIDIVDACLFVDAAFRRCSYDQFADGTAYDCDRYLHPRDDGDTFEDVHEPLALGLIGVYDTNQPFTVPAPNSESDTEDIEDDFDNFDYDPSEDLKQLNIREHLRSSDEFIAVPDEFDDSDTESEDLDENNGIIDWYPLTIEDHDLIAKRALNMIDEVDRRPHKIVYITRVICTHLHDHVYATGNVQLNDEIDTWEIVKRVIPRIAEKPGPANIYREIVNDTVHACIAAQPMREVAGLDFGEPENNRLFPEVMEKTIDYRFAKRGYKLFYPTDLCSTTSSDLGVYASTTKEWLNRYLYQFVAECRARDARPIGFIPWKLLKVSIVPIAKEPEFLNNIEQKVRDSITEIHEIKLQTKDIENYTERMDMRRQMIEARCPVRTQSARSTAATQPFVGMNPEPTAEELAERVIPQQSVLNAMNDL